ncbi:hypothetical protein KY290_026564 [Solanum tuberosum]|uniref:Protein FAR1-RELATED SEQUENCE n=1 Tax=Solanum tuberosum TaxID=4113 RepID=A0ABQ7UYH6_SOLTU|nr:hypothetical protein KY285_023232 [Solanum tuberosum]KAH0756294.1 hypothetical protein KY290_026564 [Solanum tuberosum]
MENVDVDKGTTDQEGQSNKISPFQERKRQRLEYRCGCLARIKFKISNGIWEVCEFSDEHSHPMIEGNLRHFIQSGRKLTSSTKNILGTMIDAGIRTKKAVRYLQNEAGGVENAGFIEQDAHNFGMGGKAPKTIFTDQAHAMAAAIRQGFRNYFDTLLWRCKSESEFEVIWQNMICDWNCADNSWLQKLYDLRKKWCPAFSRSIFSADIKSTQRSESTNRVFTEMACKTMSITEFVKHYEQRTIEMRDTEATEDYKCRGKPKLFVEDCGILKHAGSVYSRRIFTRWTKNARHECGFEEYTEKKETLKSSMTIRLNGLMKESFTVMTLAANDVDSEEIARKYLYLAKVEIIKHQSELYVQNHEKNRSKFNSFNESVTGCKDQILDPIKKKDKGNGYGRMKSKNEQRKKKASQRTLKNRTEYPHEYQSLNTMPGTFASQSTSMPKEFTLHGVCIQSQDPSNPQENVDTSGKKIQ